MSEISPVSASVSSEAQVKVLKIQQSQDAAVSATLIESIGADAPARTSAHPTGQNVNIAA